MRKNLKFIVAAIIPIVFVGTLVLLWAKSQPQKVEYNEIVPVRGNIEKTTIVTGKIEPRNEVNIKPQVSGIITQIMKQAGETVVEGEIIAKVKVIPDMAQLSAANARLTLAHINAKQAAIDYKREKELFDKGLIATTEYEKALQTHKQMQQEVKAAEDNLQVVRDGVSKSNAAASATLVRSTITGVILDIPVKVGNAVIPNNAFNDGTTIASVANMNDLIFRGNIDETDVGLIKKAMPMKITVGALQNVNLTASLEYIAPKAVEQNGVNQFEIKAAINSIKNVNIRSGYSANAEIILEQAKNVITLPESAIIFKGQETFVYIVKNNGDKKEYVKRKVKIGLSDGVNIEIISGITLKDVVRGTKKIKVNEEENTEIII